jgi:hypothetical protein
MQEHTSAATSINSSKVPALFKLIKWEKGMRNVDIGAGKFDTATVYLAGFEATNIPFDPYNLPKEHNERVVMDMAVNPADTATLSNVLNIIKEKGKRIKALERAKRWAKITYIKVYEGDKSGVGKVTSKGWQENRKYDDYISEVQEVFPNVSTKRKIIIAWV